MRVDLRQLKLEVNDHGTDAHVMSIPTSHPFTRSRDLRQDFLRRLLVSTLPPALFNWPDPPFFLALGSQCLQFLGDRRLRSALIAAGSAAVTIVAAESLSACLF